MESGEQVLTLNISSATNIFWNKKSITWSSLYYRMMEHYVRIMFRLIIKRSKSICCWSLYRPQCNFQACQLAEEKQFCLLLIGQTVSHRKFHLFPQNHTGESDWAKTEHNISWSEQANQSQKYLLLTLVINESFAKILWLTGLQNLEFWKQILVLFWPLDRHYSSESGLHYHI